MLSSSESNVMILAKRANDTEKFYLPNGQPLTAEEPVAIQSKLIVGGMVIAGLLFTMALNVVFVNRKRTKFYWVNVVQNVAAILSVLAATMINQELYTHSCYVLNFFASFGMAVSISGCQYVLLLRLNALVENAIMIWASTIIIVAHAVYFVVISMTHKPLVFGTGLCYNTTDLGLQVVYVVVSLCTEIYLTGHFIWQILHHIKCIQGLQRDVQVSAYRRLMDVGTYVTVINTLCGIALWVFALLPQLHQFYYTVLTLMVVAPSCTTTFLCWVIFSTVYVQGFDNTFRKRIFPVPGSGDTQEEGNVVVESKSVVTRATTMGHHSNEWQLTNYPASICEDTVTTDFQDRPKSP
ncbi:hypothetical protein IWQ62_000423 [Dispira parvispora]|uniref:Uncharacterized protein n=1 Tax=Dispira parvispora TaxID=1520584 RepID=A0A9W8B0P4_9FUNG|nr:hypothetical protein IWQ62_000423 [Dispira parvispora]